MMYNIHVDGSARPNPGIAGYAVWVEHRGETASLSGVLSGTHTNNEAEYHAVLAALQWLQVNNDEDEYVMIRSDSRLVVNQINDVMKCNTVKLREYRDSIKDIIKNAKFDVDVMWISRIQNDLPNKIAQAITQVEKERVNG